MLQYAGASDPGPGLPCVDVTLAEDDAGAPSTEESSSAARLLEEPFCDEGLLFVLPFAATSSLSVAVTAAVTFGGSVGLPLRVDK